MKKIASLIAAATIAACGQSYEPTNSANTGKADTEWEGERATWSDGSRSVGFYEWAWTDRLSPSYIDALVSEGELPAQATRPAEYYYMVESYNWDRGGYLPFFVKSERRPIKLAGDSFTVRLPDVQMKGSRPATKYRLYLFKFHNVNGVEGYTAVQMRLDEAIGGKVVTAADELPHAPGMIAALQRGTDAPDRVGFAGTWKAVVVPDYRVPTRSERLTGTKEVEINAIRMIAAPTPAPAPTTELPAAFFETHRQVVAALASRNYEQVNQFVHPDCGLHSIFAPGAHTALLGHDGASNAVAGMSDRWHAFEGADATCAAPVHAAELPHYSCEGGFTKQGCYATELNGYKELTTLQKSIDEWVTYEQTPAEQMAKLARCENSVKISVGSAVNDDRYVLNYGEIDGKWYLIVADVQVPCDA